MNRWWIALLLPAEALACARQAAPQSLPRPPSPVLAQAMKPRPPESAPLRPPDLTPPVALRSPDLTIRSVTGRPGIYHHAIAGVAFLPGGRLHRLASLATSGLCQPSAGATVSASFGPHVPQA